MPESPISQRSLDDLEQQIISLSHRLNAFEYEFLVLVREFDIRQGWKAYHFNNCAEWLNMTCGMSPGTAREKLRVAMALLDLPACSDAFATGQLSYSKARSITRVATARTEGELLEYAFTSTALQVDGHCRRLRNADRRLSTPDAQRAYNRRSLTRSKSLEEGVMSLFAEMPIESGELIMKALEKAGQDLQSTEANFFARQLDALVHMATSYLAGSDENRHTDNYQVIVHVDETALKDEGGQSDLPVESVRRLTCDGSLTKVSKDGKGNLVAMSSKQRVVSPQIKKALLARDKTCQYPGCTHERFLIAHHVVHWADGGPTTLDNLMLMCSSHHHLLHEGRYTIQTDYKGQWYFRNGNGKVIPTSPWRVTPDETGCVYDASRDAFEFVESQPGQAIEQ